MNMRSIIVLFLAQIAIGSSGIFARYAMSETGPIMIAALRLGLSALPLIILLLWKGMSSLGKKNELVLACSGILLAFHFSIWFESLCFVPVYISTVLVCTSPIWNGLIDGFIVKKRVSKLFWYALLIAMLGLVFIVLDAPKTVPQPGHAAFGYICALLGGVSISIYFVTVNYVIQQTESNKTISILDIITRTYSWAAIALFMLAFQLNQPIPGIDKTYAWGGILCMAVFSQSIGHTLMNRSLRMYNSSLVAFSTLLEPVLAAFLAFFILGEDISSRSVFGGVLICSSLFFALYENLAKKPKPTVLN